MTDNIDEIIAQIGDRHLRVLTSALAKSQQRVVDEPSAANIKALREAKSALDEMRGAGEDAPVVYGNRVEALRALQADGYKIKKSKFYADCKVGLCQLGADGSVTENELNRYVRRVGLQRLSEKSADPATNMLARKNEKEVERLEEQISKLRREREIIEGRYLERDVVEMELAGKCAVLEAGLRHLFHTRMVDWIEAAAAHGLPAALDAAQQDLNAQFNEFASLDDFEVLIGGI